MKTLKCWIVETLTLCWKIICMLTLHDRRMVSLVGMVSVYRAGGLGSIPGRTNTQGLKIIAEKVLPLL